MGHTILIWGFPFYLIILEMLFKGISGLDVGNFVGPAIATAGLSFLLPLTKPKEYRNVISEELLITIKEVGGEIVNEKDQKLIPFIWIAILCGFLMWFWASYSSASSPNKQFYFLQFHIAIGLINYSMAAFFTFCKDKV